MLKEVIAALSYDFRPFYGEQIKLPLEVLIHLTREEVARAKEHGITFLVGDGVELFRLARVANLPLSLNIEDLLQGIDLQKIFKKGKIKRLIEVLEQLLGVAPPAFTERLKCLGRKALWVQHHGRFPESEAVRGISKELIPALADGKRMKFFLRLVRKEGDIREHDAEAAARLAVWLGEKAESFVAKSGLSVHDAGINLPVGQTVTADKVAFLFRYAHKAAEAIRVVGAWETVTGELAVNPMEKGGLEAALEALKALHYEGTRHSEFARVAAECGVSQWEFVRTQDRWLAGLEQLAFQSVPSPGTLEDGELRLVQLRKDDPRGLFLGVLTGCCQHPQGAGAASAWHGHESGDGAFWAIERNGRIIAQAWVWRHEDNLVLDSVEATASIGDETRARAKALFQAAANAVIGKLGVNRVYVGTGYGGILWNELASNRRPFHCPADYSDSSSVWLIAEQAAKPTKTEVL